MTDPSILSDTPDAILATPEMIEAGVTVLRARTFGEPLNDVVQDVFYAMLAERDG